jgi:hypothetical protein
MASVRIYFFGLYNASKGDFREWLVSVGNNDALTGNRLFDRHNAVGMIKQAARDAKDSLTADARDGDIYRCLVNLLRYSGLGLKLRRAEYLRITTQAEAAE